MYVSDRTAFPVISAEEAAALIPHGSLVGFSGFTPAGAAKAVQETGKKGTIKIVGMDLDNALADLIDKDQVQATMVQGAWHMGYWGLWMSYAAAHGLVDAGIPEFTQAGISPLPSYVDTGAYEVTKDNLKFFRDLSKP